MVLNNQPQRIGYGMLLALVALLAGCGGLSSEPKTVSTLIPATNEPPTVTIAPTTVAAALPTSAATTSATQPAATQAATEPTVLGIVNGRVENHTKDGKVPPDTKVTLHIIDQNDASAAETTFSATINAQGGFEFRDVPMRANLAYAVTTAYLDRQLSSEVVTGDPTVKAVTIPVPIYETTTDPAVLSVAAMITQVNADPGGLQIAQVIHVTNSSDRMFSGDKALNSDPTGGKLFPSVSFKLPVGAALMGFGDTSGRFVTSTDGTTITDTAPVLPGEDHVIHFIYVMPYKSEGTTIEQPLPYAFHGQVQVLLRPTSVSFDSAQLFSLGLQTKNSVDYLTYGANLTLAAGQAIRFAVSGQLAAAPGQQPATSLISRDLLVGLLIGAGFGLIVLGGVFLVRDRLVASRAGRPATANETEGFVSRERLVSELARLDEAYEGGKLRKAAYEKKRQQLKQRLARLMKD